MQPQYASAGNAEEKSANAVNPVGLYRNKANGEEIGVLDPVAGDAVIRQGFELVQEGREAAMSAGTSKAAREQEKDMLFKDEKGND